MIVDFQMQTQHFLHGIRNKLRSVPVCFPKEIPYGNATAILNRFVITDDTTLKRIPRSANVIGRGNVLHKIDGSALSLSQKILLHFTTIADLQNNGTSPTPPSSDPVLNQSVEINCELIVKVSPDGQPALHIENISAVIAPGLGALVPDIDQQITNALAGFRGALPIYLSGLSDLIGGYSFINTGIAIDDASAFVTLRMEVGTEDDTVAAWKNFFAGNTPSLLNGRQWGLFIDKRILLPVFLEIFKGGTLAGEQFSPSGPPTAEWASNGHGVHIARSGTLVDAGPLDTDVDVTVHLNVDFSVLSADVLVFDLSISASGEVGGIVGAFMDFIGMDADPRAAFPTVKGWVKTSDTSYSRKQFLSIRHQLFGSFIVESVEPDQNGLHLVGSVRSSPAVKAANVEATLRPFKWDVHGSCSDGWNISCVGYLGLENTGTAPLSVCEARVLADPDGQFPLKIRLAETPSSAFAAEVRIEFVSLKPEYEQRNPPYPCLIVVKTNGGARVVSLGVPLNLDGGNRHGMENERIVRIGNCKMLVDNFWGSKLNPRWIPDPRPDERSLHLWQVLVRGLDEAEQVTMLDHLGRVLAIAPAGANGVAHVRSVLAPATDNGLTLVRTGSTNELRETRNEAEDRRSIEIRQVLLEPTATLHAGQQVVGLLSGQYQDVPVLIVLGGAQSLLYDVRVPARPSLIRELASNSLIDTPLSLRSIDIPAGSNAVLPGLTYARDKGVLIGEVFARLEPDKTAITLYAARGSRHLPFETADALMMETYEGKSIPKQ